MKKTIRNFLTLLAVASCFINSAAFGDELICSKEMVISLPFASQPETKSCDIEIPIADSSILGKVSEFEIEFECDKPDAVQYVTIHFHSGNGSYKSDIWRFPPLPDKSQGNNIFQLKNITYKNFTRKGTPNAWNQADKIQITIWQGKPIDTTFKVRKIFVITDSASPYRNIVKTWRKLFNVGDTRNRTEEQRIELTKTLLAELKQHGFDLTPEFFQSNADETAIKNFAPRFQELSDTLNSMLQDAIKKYCASVPSQTPEFRAWWVHDCLGLYPGDWDKTMKELSEAGFNAVVVNFLHGALAHYPSDVVPRSDVYRQHGDQLAEAIKAGKKYGVEVHVWQICWNLSGAPQNLIDTMKQSGRTLKNYYFVPNTEEWLCPSHPDNQDLECQMLCELAEKYPDLAGIHFDYIRYPDYEHCYCDGCRDRFIKDTGCTIKKWPQDVRKYPVDSENGIYEEQYNQWRYEQITKIVERVHREVKKIRSNIKISAAVFPDYPSCRRGMGQDWVTWAKNGYLDFICPMDYTENLEKFESRIQEQRELIQNKIPLYPGIGATATGILMTPDQVMAEIQISRDFNSSGFVIFNLTDGRIFKTILPILKFDNSNRK